MEPRDPARRRFVACVGAFVATLAARRTAGASGPATADAGPDLDLVDMRLDGDPALARRAVLLVPRAIPPGAPGGKLPLLVLLHGLGETGDERAGAYAWLERYGLGSAYGRLLRPPVVPTGRRGDLVPARAAEISRALQAKPFRGMVIACPYTPNIWRAPSAPVALDGYAAWIARTLLPAVRERAPASAEAARTGLDGCSLGGFVAIEAFLRRPETFGAVGGVQSALNGGSVPATAERLAAAARAHGTRGVHVETSSMDPFREANVALAAELRKRGVPHELLVAPGPHDQPWLREVGTLEMLLWHDRALWRD